MSLCVNTTSIAICVCLLGAGSSRAFGASESADAAKAQAQITLREGNALLEQGRPADALVKFTEAHGLFPSPKIHYNIGQAQSLIPGHEAQAYQAMSSFLGEAKDASPALRAAAEGQLQQLRSKVALIAVLAHPADADLLVDDVNVGKVSPLSPVILGVGPHRLALQKGSATSTATTLSISGGEMSNVQLRLTAVPQPVVAVAPSPPVTPLPVVLAVTPPPPPQVNVVQPAPTAPGGDSWTWQRKLGMGLLGLSVASLVFGIVEHVRYFGAQSDYKQAGCFTTDPHPGASCLGLEGKFNSANTGWIVGYIAAAAAAGGGASLLWLGPAPGPAASEHGVAASAGFGAGAGMTLNFQGRF